MSRLLDAKAGRRRTLAQADFATKIQMLVRLQEMTAPILQQRGIQVKPWRLAKKSMFVS